MDSLKLNEPEQRLYQELFHSCDVDGTGKVSSSRANELFRTTGLSQDTLHQITELCGAKRLGLFGRSQFYVALKLVSIAQSKLPVSLESLGSEVSLPDFSQPPPAAPKLTDLEQEAASGDSGKGVAPAIGHLPPPPTKKHSRNLSGQYRGVGAQPPEAAPQATVQPQFQNNIRGDSPHKSPAFSPEQSPPISPPTRLRGSLDDSMAHPLTAPVHTTPSAARNNSTAVNSVHEAGWAQFENDEQHGLLGSGTTVKSWEHLEGRAVDSSSISSEAESVDDVWTISDEQRDYYITQFKTMQPDLNGVIKGNIAKEFFEKSRLPVQELSKIWQLSDFNKDGALSLEEFCTAMHLVVLKRNDVELPNHLPPSLMPYSTLVNDEPFASDLPPGSTIKRVSPLSPSASQWSAAFLSDSSSDLSSPVIKPVKFEVNPVTHDPEANIVHPVALRMSPDGHTFPPLEHLVDRSRTASDPVHYETNHDVPDMLTPSKQRSNTESYSMEPMSPSIKLHGNLQGRPRPVAKKAASATVPGQLQPPPTSQGSGAAEGVTDDVFPSPGSPQGEPPPPPPPDTGPPGPPLPHSGAAPPQLPPRPTMHNRSISVDLKLKIDGGLMPPPAVPPRISPRDGHKKVSEKFTFGPVDSDRLSKPDATKLKRFEPIPSQEVLTIINNTEMESPERKVISGQSTLERHRRAKSLDFHQTPVASKQTDVHNTDQTDSSNVASIPEDVLVVEEPGDLMQSDDVCEPQAAEISRPPVIGIRQASRDKRDVQLALRTHRERNAMLGRLNSELNQELQEVMEQRIALEIQLEHLRPFSS